MNDIVEGDRHVAGQPSTTWATGEASISTGGHDYTQLTVAANPNGQMVVAFKDSTGPAADAVSGTVSGGWGATPAIAKLSSDPVLQGPAVTMLDKGGAAVGWATGSAVQMSLRPPSGSFPPPAQVKAVPATASSFALGSDGQGEIIAAWYAFNNTSMTNVVSASVKPQASPTFGPPQIISDPTVYSGAPGAVVRPSRRRSRRVPARAR